MGIAGYLARVVALCGAIVATALAPPPVLAKPFVIVHGQNLLTGVPVETVVLPDSRVLSAADLRLRAAAHLNVGVELLVFDVATNFFVQRGLCELLVLDRLTNPQVFDPGTGGFRTLNGFETVSAILAATGTFAFVDDLKPGPCARTVNLPPVANAGPDQTVETTSSATALVTLNGNGSNDPDSDSLIFAWSGPFGTAGGATPTVELAVDVAHTITLTVIDPSGASDSEIVIITVTRVADTTAPAISAPADVVAEGPLTAANIGTATASDDVDPAPLISSDAPASFPLGTTVVTWTATDATGNSATATQNVTVVDTTPPAITPPADIVAEATGQGGAAVAFAAPAVSDLVDPSPNLVAAPASGSTFPLGPTTVTWTATDASGNSAQASFTVTVVDTTPPAITQPANVTAEATGPSGAVVSFAAPAVTDLVDPMPTLIAAPASGSTFPLGPTTVTWTATDASGNSAQASFTVTVRDTTAPAVTPPPDVIAVVAGALTSVDLQEAQASAADLVDGALIPTPNNPGPFPPGVSTVTWSATDAAGNIGTATQTVSVLYAFSGFEPPIENLPAVNAARSGSVVPVKWQLSDGNGGFIRDLAVVNSIQFAQVVCTDAGNVFEMPEDADATGQTVLRYDSSAEHFVFNWKTGKDLKGNCFVVILGLNDASKHLARVNVN